MKLFVWPQPDQFPERGGVRQHLIQFYKQAEKNVELVKTPEYADVYHVESSWELPNSFPKKPMVYVCHGGFVPSPIPSVLRNLKNADMIVSVADWLADTYFHQYISKTVTIANGVDLAEIESYTASDPFPVSGFILYAKEWNYYFDDLLIFAEMNPDQLFLTTYWPAGKHPVSNIHYIGLQSYPRMMRVLKNAKALLLTGSEVCPTMLLEAWALKVPVVARDCDGSAEIMRPFSTDEVVGGLLYKSPFRLTETVSNEFLAQEGIIGHNRVKTLYDWPTLFQKYLTVYDRVLDS